MERLDAIPIRGDCKIWIYRYYVIPAIFFQLAVNNIPPTTISKIQAMATHFLKKWLRLLRCATLSILFHPNVLNLPYLPHSQEKAKLNLLTTVTSSPDPKIKELLSSLLNMHHSLGVSPTCITVFQAARVLIKVLASCQPDQKAAEPCFSMKGLTVHLMMELQCCKLFK